jgi:hypothetical protein
MIERDTDPWERLPDETSKAYAAFRQYRDLGPTRTVTAMSGVSQISAGRWARQHRWPARAAAWDAEAYRIEDARRLDQIREMDENHQRAARALLTAGLRALQDLGPLTPHQAARFVDLGTRLERSALLGEHLPPPALAIVEPDDDLSPLERIARELAGIA